MSKQTKIIFHIVAASLIGLLIITGDDLIDDDYHLWVLAFPLILATCAFSRESMLSGFLNGMGMYLIELVLIGLGVFGILPMDLRGMYQYIFLAGITYVGGIVLFAIPFLAYVSNKIWRLFT